MSWQLTIAVCGGQHCSDEVSRSAQEVGREIGRAGAVLICGGLTGVMEAACRGASEEGGVTIGILPGNSPLDANQWVTFPIATGIGHARNSIVVGSAHAVIAIDGEYGTLSEIAYAAKLGIPVVGLGTWSVTHPSGLESRIVPASDPRKAVTIAIELARASGRVPAAPLD